MAFDDSRLESALEEVAASFVPPVEPHGVDAVQALHPTGELRLRRPDEQVEVIVEQVPGMHVPAEAPLDVDEELEPGLAVEIVAHDRPLVDTPADDVVPGRARQLAPRDPGHDRRRYLAVCSGETGVKGQLSGTVPGTRPSQTLVMQTGA